MDDTPRRNFSFPNADQEIPGVSDAGRQTNLDTNTQADHQINTGFQSSAPRPTVNIIDALNSEKTNDNDIRTLRTYQQDITEAIKNDNVSMIKVALAEKKRQESQGTGEKDLFEKNNSKKYVLLIGGACVAVIFLIAGYFYVSSQFRADNTPVVSTEAEPLLYTEKNVSLSIDGKDPDDISRIVKRELDTDMDLGTMEAISLTTGSGTTTHEVSSSEFFQALDVRAPDSLIRSINPQFLLGVYSFSPKDFFAIFKINSYDNAFAGMLQWEPYMEQDVGNIFITRKIPVPITTLTATTSQSSATSSSTPTSLFSSRVWVDRVIDNKDARVLIDTDGKPAMLYTFLDKQTLVVASSEKSLEEISFRLTTGRIVR